MDGAWATTAPRTAKVLMIAVKDFILKVLCVIAWAERNSLMVGRKSKSGWSFDWKKNLGQHVKEVKFRSKLGSW